MGEMAVPDEALFGASTQRAVLNFPISGRAMPPEFLHGLGLVKLACAQANEELGLLPRAKAELIRRAAREVAEGRLDAHFPVDVFQTGSGTSTNMNANEVIANRASQLAGEPIGSKRPAHPNDDVNLGQSSNDIIPTALHVSVALALARGLRPALEHLREALEAKAREFDAIIKIGRTHLMDATPLTLGQEVSGYAAQVAKGVERVDKAVAALRELAVGGTAVGTGINCDPRFGGVVARILSAETGLEFVEARNHFEAQAARDDAVEAAGQIAAIAASLTKIANDIRLLGSGPRAGLGELRLPATQPGSSIMPGKVNPVIPEVVNQVAYQVIGNDLTVTFAAEAGQLQLNAFEPVITFNILQSMRIMTRAMQVLTERCIRGITANAAHCRALVTHSIGIITALNPFIGYHNSTRIAKKALESGRGVAELVLEEGLLSPAELDDILTPENMTRRRRIDRKS